MKPAVVRAFVQPLAIEERPVPTPGHGQVLVKMEACGLCHTDIHAAHGDWPVKPNRPFVPGHEGVGVVTALGQGVQGIAEGDRVAIPMLDSCSISATNWPYPGRLVADLVPFVPTLGLGLEQKLVG